LTSELELESDWFQQPLSISSEKMVSQSFAFEFNLYRYSVVNMNQLELLRLADNRLEKLPVGLSKLNAVGGP
jgi:hypothetical protein